MYNFLRGKSLTHLNQIARMSIEATLNLESPFALHLLEKGPSQSIKVNKKEGEEYFRDMDIVRKFENSCAQLYREKVIRGFCHLYVGEEAVAEGIYAAMRPQDICITSYRDHGMAYKMGATVEEVMCELTGRASGASRGKGGSMHMYAPRLFGGNGIVGSHIPVGTGMALAMKFLKQNAVSVTMYGDGAANQGQCFEAFNLAKILNIPVIFVCENNHYGLGTFYKRVTANPKFYTRCEYIPGIFLDGMDVFAVREGIRFAIDYAIKGNGPIIVECMTYRYYGHSMSDPGNTYRKREDVEEVREKKDCLKKLKKYLITSKLSTEEELKNIEKNNKARVAKATEFAKTDKFPPPEELNTDIYCNPLDNIRNILPHKPLPHILSKKYPIKT